MYHLLTTNGEAILIFVPLKSDMDGVTNVVLLWLLCVQVSLNGKKGEFTLENVLPGTVTGT